ncbi:MAG: VapE domain-containing protein, partial [Clostridia bacterium]
MIAKAAWFSDSLSFEDMRDKTAAEKIQGTWLNEISELKGMRKTEVESVKSFISRQEDIYRPSYGRQVEHHKRSCVFIGTSNADDYLKDVTGNRRFWPVKCSGQTKKRPWELTADAVAQIWAEVLFYYDGLDEKTLVLPKDVEKEALEHQVAALEHDERLGLVAVYLEKLLPKNWASMDLT